METYIGDDFPLMITLCVVFSYEIMRHGNLFSAQRSYMKTIYNYIYGRNLGNCVRMQMEYIFNYAYRTLGI
jgi:hypothetical protein